jgi:uncharacterized protein YrrD
MTTDIWNWPTTDSASGSRLSRNVVGYEVEATDGTIGKIDEASFDVSSGYMVVDTGKWIFEKKRLVPAGVVTRIDDDKEVVYVKCTKDAIKSAPDYEPDQPTKREADYMTRHGEYYGGL